jgi:hypothetical protein
MRCRVNAFVIQTMIQETWLPSRCLAMDGLSDSDTIRLLGRTPRYYCFTPSVTFSYTAWQTVFLFNASFFFALFQKFAAILFVSLFAFWQIITSIYLSIYDSTVLLLDLGRFFSFLIFTQSVGLLGRGISPSQDRYLHTGEDKYRINAHRHPWFEWDSNPRSQCWSGRRRFMP